MTSGRRTGMGAGGRGNAGATGRKRVAILKAAQRLISSNGLDETSMDAVARCADVSKATVYAYFRSKEVLFKMALDDMIRGMPDPREALAGPGDSLHARLTAAAHAVLNLATGPTMQGLHRTLAASRRLSPRRADVYWEICFGRHDKAMQEFLKSEAAKGALAISDLACASSQFFGLIAGAPAVRALLTGEPFVSGQQLSDYVNNSVSLFIRGYQPGFDRSSGG